MSKITLFPYQQHQVELIKQNKTFNFSDVGTGKTFVGLEGFKQSNCTKLLVICLATKVQDFADDGKLLDLDITPLNKGTKKNKLLLKDQNQIAISFESVWRLDELLEWVDKDTYILIDESHKIKSRSSKVGYFVTKLANQAQLVYQMTATPITNGKYEEFFQQLVIAGLIDTNWKFFEQEYLQMELQSVKVQGQTRYFNEIVGYKNIDKLMHLVESHAVYQQRTLTIDQQPLEIIYTAKKPTMYNKLARERVVQLDTGELKEYDSTSSVYHAMRQLASGVLNGIGKTIRKDKIERVRDILATTDERVVIFYNYTSELHALEQLLSSLDRPYSTFNGSSHDRSLFENNHNGVCLVQYKAGSTGVNGFQIASVCIMFSLADGSTTHIQAMGRINRIGQTKQPIFYMLVCENSVESKVLRYIIEGKDITDNMLDSLIQS